MAETADKVSDDVDAADPGARGTLIVRHRAVENVALAATVRTDGVQRSTGNISKLTGRTLPRVAAVVSGDRVRASVDVAVEWGRPLGDVAQAVQTNVTQALSTISGLVVDGIDVHVAGVVGAGGHAEHRSLA